MALLALNMLVALSDVDFADFAAPHYAFGDTSGCAEGMFAVGAQRQVQPILVDRVVGILVLVDKTSETCVGASIAFLITTLLANVHPIFRYEAELFFALEAGVLQIVARVIVNQLHLVLLRA